MKEMTTFSTGGNSGSSFAGGTSGGGVVSVMLSSVSVRDFAEVSDDADVFAVSETVVSYTGAVPVVIISIVCSARFSVTEDTAEVCAGVVCGGCSFSGSSGVSP